MRNWNRKIYQVYALKYEIRLPYYHNRLNYRCCKYWCIRVYAFEQSIIPRIIEQWWINRPIWWTHLPPIDSLIMKNPYRDTIVETSKNIPEDRILITHGTDTMIETAQYLVERVQWKVIVLVWSMVPIREPNTDGYMNLGYALWVLQFQKRAWVFIAMNGKMFFPRNVRKNREEWRFEVIQ